MPLPRKRTTKRLMVIITIESKEKVIMDNFTLPVKTIKIEIAEIVIRKLRKYIKLSIYSNEKKEASINGIRTEKKIEKTSQQPNKIFSVFLYLGLISINPIIVHTKRKPKPNIE